MKRDRLLLLLLSSSLSSAQFLLFPPEVCGEIAAVIEHLKKKKKLPCMHHSTSPSSSEGHSENVTWAQSQNIHLLLLTTEVFYSLCCGGVVMEAFTLTALSWSQGSSLSEEEKKPLNGAFYLKWLRNFSQQDAKQVREPSGKDQPAITQLFMWKAQENRIW